MIAKSLAIKIALEYVERTKPNHGEVVSARLVTTDMLAAGGFAPPGHKDCWVVAIQIFNRRADFSDEVWNWLTAEDRKAVLENPGIISISVDAQIGVVVD